MHCVSHTSTQTVQVRCTMPELCVWVGWATAWQPGSCLLTQTNCTTASRVLWLSETPAVRWWYHKSVCKCRCGNRRGSTPLSNVPNCESPRGPKISNDKWSKQLSVHSLVCLSPQAYRWNRTSKLQQIVWCISHDDLASAWQRLTMNLSAAYNSTTISVTSNTIATGGSSKQPLAAVGYKLYGHWSSSFTVTNGSKNVATSSVCLYLANKWNCCRSYDCSLKKRSIEHDWQTYRSRATGRPPVGSSTVATNWRNISPPFYASARGTAAEYRDEHVCLSDSCSSHFHLHGISTASIPIPVDFPQNARDSRADLYIIVTC